MVRGAYEYSEYPRRVPDRKLRVSTAGKAPACYPAYFRAPIRRPTFSAGRGSPDKLRCDENFAVPFGIGEVVECLTHSVQADLSGDHRGDVDLAFGQRAQRRGELIRGLGQ